MCLAIYAPKKSDKNSEFLFEAIKTASITNSDGMGFAFKRASTKKVYISKGYTTVSSFIDAIKNKKLGDNDELIAHLRIGNKGAIGTDMCHPFVASKEHKEVLSNDAYVNEPVFIHNGTLSKYSKFNDIFSDTYYFAKDFASYKSALNILKTNKSDFEELFSEHIQTSRFVFLFPNEATDGIMLGDFTEDNGYYFSNTSYKSSRYKNVGGYEIDTYNDEYYGGYYGSDYFENLERARTFIDEDDEDDIATQPNTYVEGNKRPTVTTYNYTKSKVIVPDDFCTEAYTDPITGVKYRYYLGLWVPNSGYNEIRIDPNGLNYTDLICEARTNNEDYDIKKNHMYDISIFDENCLENFKLHTLLERGKNHSDNIFIYHQDLVTKFEINPKINSISFYEEYIDFVNSQNHSKNNLKKISKKLNKDVSKDLIWIQNHGKVDRELLELYRYNLIKHISKNEHQSKELYNKYCFE